MTKRNGVIAFFFMMFLFLGLYMSMLQRVVGEIADRYGLDNTAMGTIIMMTFAGFLISPILTGEATDRFGRRSVLLFAFAGMLIGLTLSLGLNSPIGIAIGFFVVGLAFGVFEMTLSSVLTDIRPEGANRILNYSRLFYALGTILGPFAAMGILAVTGDWKFVMLCDLVVFAVLFGIFLLLSFPRPIYPNLIVKEKGQPSTTLRLMKSKVLWLLGLSVMMYMAVEAGLTFYVSEYINQMSSGLLFSTLTLSVFWLFVAVGRIFTARFQTRLHVVIGALALLAAAGLAICMVTGDLALSIIAFGVMGLGCSGMYPTLLAVGKIRFPKYTATVFGILLSVGSVGGIVLPLVMGSVADASGLKAALGICLAPLALMVVLQAVLGFAKGFRLSGDHSAAELPEASEQDVSAGQ